MGDANRELATLVRYRHYKLKQVIQQNEALSTECQGLIDKVENMRKWNRRLEADAKWRK